MRVAPAAAAGPGGRKEGSYEPARTDEVQEHQNEDSPGSLAFWRVFAATFLHGIGSGVIGILVALLIKSVQVISFGSSSGGFLEIAMRAPVWRRMLAVSFGGVFGATAWYWLRGRETLVVGVSESMDQGKEMPVGTTVMNAMVQDITVALGGSFGREAAPRELCAMWGGIMADNFGVLPTQRKTLVACGTGAGLAAVYCVPVSGIFYTIEHILNWDVSLGAVVAAIVTSVVATIVASCAVETTGLYHAHRHSYTWPSPAVLLWALFIGPVTGVAAAAFTKLIGIARTYRPTGRIPVKFDVAPVGHNVYLLSSADNDGARRVASIVTKTWDRICVRYHDAEGEQELDEAQWKELAPKGERDWNILIAMPAAFFVLALFSVDFPSLLGNGRALAQVAIFRQRTLTRLGMLFFLKALLTTAAIGSGVDGGTLTPCVALGATLGAVVGGALQLWLTTWLPNTEVMAIICSAAFLAAAMKAPITAMFLILEFSDQGIAQHDLVACFHGDFSGLLRSKLAAGMVLPLVVAIAGAMWSSKLCLSRPAVPKLYSPCLRRSNATLENLYVHSQDLDLGHQHDKLDFAESTKEFAFVCFRRGLLLNTVLTITAGCVAPTRHRDVTIVSLIGIALSTVLGTTLWVSAKCTDSDADGENDDGETSIPNSISSRLSQRLSQQTYTYQAQVLAFVAFCAALGAMMPLVPWVLHVWRDHGRFTALCTSAICALVGSAYAAALDVKLPHRYHDSEEPYKGGLRWVCVAREVAFAALAVAVGVVAGIAIARICPGVRGL